MKLIGLMSLELYREQVRKLFEKRHIHIYSEMEIVGHTADTISKYGWWVFEKEGLPIYSTLFFAVVGSDKADEIMQDVANSGKDWGEHHPPRAFQIDVEKMI